jgi:hypothetical protein
MSNLLYVVLLAAFLGFLVCLARSLFMRSYLEAFIFSLFAALVMFGFYQAVRPINSELPPSALFERGFGAAMPAGASKLIAYQRRGLESPGHIFLNFHIDGPSLESLAGGAHLRKCSSAEWAETSLSSVGSPPWWKPANSRLDSFWRPNATDQAGSTQDISIAYSSGERIAWAIRRNPH